ncbi:unnamed protein product [Strongylus vulgaris]|uniref:Uncharacterized protein n=1 Tax=Strongylus vulgaris TaxID=40348 RepID=A0A3P7JD89_STRVU|nr:unnamed protein product [Strongylus vulgaris]VDM80643.1 unnamed protein product [Strongylus vulgaris]
MVVSTPTCEFPATPVEHLRVSHRILPNPSPASTMDDIRTMTMSLAWVSDH